MHCEPQDAEQKVSNVVRELSVEYYLLDRLVERAVVAHDTY